MGATDRRQLSGENGMKKLKYDGYQFIAGYISRRWYVFL